MSSLSNIGCWATHLRLTDPRRYGHGAEKPHLEPGVQMVMEALHRQYASTFRERKLEYLAGVAPYTAYGRPEWRRMMKSLVLSTSREICESLPVTGGGHFCTDKGVCCHPGAQAR